MNGRYFGWFSLFALVALAPIGLRVLTWPKTRPQSVDADMVQEGQRLFLHEWTPGDPLARGGDGLGPVYNASSCVACHHLGGAGGSGGLEHNVTLFTVRPMRQGDQPRQGVIHSYAIGEPETLAQVHSALPAVSQIPLARLLPLANSFVRPLPVPRGVHLTQRNTPALFGASLIDALPDRLIIANERREQLKWGLASRDDKQAPVGRAFRLADGRVGRFGWKGQMASLAEFVQSACANELGLGNPGQAQPRPLSNPDYEPPGLDLTLEQCDQLTAFVAALPRPVERAEEDAFAREQVQAGKALFRQIGCTDCHKPDIGPVEGVYSDLLLHHMGETLEGGGSGYGQPPPPEEPDDIPTGSPQPDEWRTPPLWGVADSSPYMHDGRAATLQEAIKLHAGQGERAAQRFAHLDVMEQNRLLAFLQSLRAPGCPDHCPESRVKPALVGLTMPVQTLGRSAGVVRSPGCGTRRSTRRD